MHSDLSSNVKASNILNTKRGIHTLVREFKMVSFGIFFVCPRIYILRNYKHTGQNLRQQPSLTPLIIITNIKLWESVENSLALFSPKEENQNEMQISTLI